MAKYHSAQTKVKAIPVSRSVLLRVTQLRDSQLTNDHSDWCDLSRRFTFNFSAVGSPVILSVGCTRNQEVPITSVATTYLLYQLMCKLEKQDGIHGDPEISLHIRVHWDLGEVLQIRLNQIKSAKICQNFHSRGRGRGRVWRGRVWERYSRPSQIQSVKICPIFTGHNEVGPR